MKKILFCLIASSTVFVACQKSTSNPSYTPVCTSTGKSFNADVLPILKTSCADCHSFNSFASVSGLTAKIRSKIVDGSMPKVGTLTTAQKNAIVCWIDNGATNN
jgi:hypothetical protein